MVILGFNSRILIMKFNNRTRVRLLTILFSSIICLLIAALFLNFNTEFKLTVLGSIIILLVFALFTNYTEFASNNDCLTIKKLSFYKFLSIRHSLEIPKIYIHDYVIYNTFFTYYLTLQIDKGSGGINDITISLWGFTDYEVISIAKIIESIKKENLEQDAKIMNILLQLSK